MENNQEVPVSVMNQRILESLDRGEVKKAQSASTSFTRTQIREGSFAFQIIPPEQATDDQLVPSLNHDKPQIYEELEPDSPGARWVPFQTVPEGEYIFGSRYIVPLARVITPKFEKDIDELRTYKTDLRKVLTDNSIKDGLKEIDGKFMGLCQDIVSNDGADTPVVDGAGVTQEITGKVQWEATAQELNRVTLANAKKLLLKGSTFTGMEDKFVLRNYVALLNDVTAQDILKFHRDEAGGDLSEEMLKNGLVLDKIMGMKTIYTIKRSLVPDNTIYFFPSPEFIGKCYHMTDWTMYMKKEAFNLEMFSYWLGGMAIGNVAGVARYDFNAS